MSGDTDGKVLQTWAGMLIGTVELGDLSGHGSLWSLGSPEVELSHSAGSAEDQEIGQAPRRTPFLHNLFCPVSSLWGPLTSLCLSLFVSDDRDHCNVFKSQKSEGMQVPRLALAQILLVAGSE